MKRTSLDEQVRGQRTQVPIGLYAAGFAIAMFLTTALSCEPRWLLKRIAERYPGCDYFIETTEPIVALTIDDGPDSISTPKILQVLSRHQARATFFLISSRVPGNENIVSEIVTGGHEIGNHLTKEERSIELSREEFTDALHEADSVLSDYAKLHWFRPGGGWYNAMMISIVREYNYRCALGSVYPVDVLIPWEWFTVQFVLLGVRPGAIIVLHDSGSRGERTARVLGRILPELTRRGFRVVTLSEAFEAKSKVE